MTSLRTIAVALLLVGCAASDASPRAGTADTGADTCGMHAPEVHGARAWWGSADDEPVLVITGVVEDRDGDLHEATFEAWCDDVPDGRVATDDTPVYQSALDLTGDRADAAGPCDAVASYPLLLTIPAAALPPRRDLKELGLHVVDADGHASDLIVRKVCSGMDRDC